jgi:hypothetical protein
MCESYIFNIFSWFRTCSGGAQGISPLKFYSPFQIFSRLQAYLINRNIPGKLIRPRFPDGQMLKVVSNH